MTVISRKGLIKRLEKRNLFVSPILDKNQIGSCSIDLRLGTVALMVRARGLSHVNPQEYLSDGYHNEQGKRQKLERHEIPFNEQLLLHPRMLTLVPTLEWVKLPSDLQGIVTARSCWAREGLNIATATFINPGYAGIITLELSNLGQIPIALFPGMRLAQIALYSIDKNHDKQPCTSQFHMSFEPQAGEIAKGDDAFIPQRDKNQVKA